MAEIMAAEKIGWTGILLAALGSSAIGAIFGGYLTTRMRGRLEREEAWRARLIEAANDFNNVLVEALYALGGTLPPVSRGERELRGTDGTLTDETAAAVNSAKDCLDQARVRLGHLELLFSEGSDVYRHALRSVQLLGRSVALVKGRASAQALIQAVLADRASPGTGRTMLADGRDMSDLETLSARWTLPDSFDPSDGANVAQWARELHHAASENTHSYMRAALEYIEHYRST